MDLGHVLVIVLFVVSALLSIIGALIMILLSGILSELKKLRADMSLALQAQAVLRTIVDGLPCRVAKCSTPVQGAE